MTSLQAREPRSEPVEEVLHMSLRAAHISEYQKTPYDVIARSGATWQSQAESLLFYRKNDKIETFEIAASAQASPCNDKTTVFRQTETIESFYCPLCERAAAKRPKILYNTFLAATGGAGYSSCTAGGGKKRIVLLN